MAGKERSSQPIALIQKEANINHCHPQGTGVSPPMFAGQFMKSAGVAEDDNPLSGVSRDLHEDLVGPGAPT